MSKRHATDTHPPKSWDVAVIGGDRNCQVVKVHHLPQVRS